MLCPQAHLKTSMQTKCGANKVYYGPFENRKGRTMKFKVNSLWMKIKAQHFARQVLRKHTFKIWRTKKGIDFFDHSTSKHRSYKFYFWVSGTILSHFKWLEHGPSCCSILRLKVFFAVVIPFLQLGNRWAGLGSWAFFAFLAVSRLHVAWQYTLNGRILTSTLVCLGQNLL